MESYGFRWHLSCSIYFLQKADWTFPSEQSINYAKQKRQKLQNPATLTMWRCMDTSAAGDHLHCRAQHLKQSLICTQAAINCSAWSGAECHKDSNVVFPKLFLIVYHLWLPYCHHIPPCSRKSQCAKYYSIKRSFLETNKGIRLHKIQDFISRTRQVKTIAVNVFYCEDKQKIGLFAYHLEGLRVAQFENHCSNEFKIRCSHVAPNAVARPKRDLRNVLNVEQQLHRLTQTRILIVVDHFKVDCTDIPGFVEYCLTWPAVEARVSQCWRVLVNLERWLQF